MFCSCWISTCSLEYDYVSKNHTFLEGVIFTQLSFWISGLSSVFILGMYLIFTGLGRFVEEAYRGEVQTPFLFGLRLCQWMAILSVTVGAIFTTIRINEIHITPTIGPSIFIGALIIGIISFFAMGVDFPKSNLRFSRLV